MCDFRFALIDAFDGQTIGSVVSLTDVPVDEGLFTVELDFGVNAFDGGGRLLDIEVRCPGGSGAYTTLSPRQKLTAAPYALYALQAPWSGLKNVPPGLDDGDDNTTYEADIGLTLTGDDFSLSPTYRLPQTCSNGQIAEWDGSLWGCATVNGGGDITAVYAGAGLIGGATSGDATLSVDFDGSGAASSAAHSDHDHLGQTWTGNDNPLEIQGSFVTAPLVVRNDTGNGIIIEEAGFFGLQVTNASYGLLVHNADSDGIWVQKTNGDGVHVVEAGDDGFSVSKADRHGVYVHMAGIK